MQEEKKKTYNATWKLSDDPLYYLECPHCKSTLLLSREKLITRLKKWFKQAKDVIL